MHATKMPRYTIGTKATSLALLAAIDFITAFAEVPATRTLRSTPIAIEPAVLRFLAKKRVV